MSIGSRDRKEQGQEGEEGAGALGRVRSRGSRAVPYSRNISEIQGISGNNTDISTAYSLLFSKWLKSTPQCFRMLPNSL